MSPRRRKEINRPLRPGMRVRHGYYSWTHPETGEELGLGRDRQKAVAEVIAAEAFIASKRLTLVERISGAGTPWSQWCTDFEAILAARDSKPNTVRTRKSQMVRLRAAFPADASTGRVDTKDCARVVDKLVDAGKHRTAQAFRSFLIDCFDRAIAKGIRKDNPARVLDPVRVKVRRARLTLEAFQSVYRTTSFQWLRNAMALAIVSGQDRDSVGTARFADVHDGHWWNERSKSGARVALPVELRLDAVGLSLGDVVRQCRATGVVSRHLVHETTRKRGCTLGKAKHLDQITRAFTAEIRRLDVDWGDRRPPTFHEIRSLSSRLYKAQGNVSPQELLGHRDPRTTAIYTDGRGEWVKVGVRA